VTTASTLGEIALDSGDLEAADKNLTEWLDRSNEIGYRPVTAYLTASRAILSLLRDDVDPAEVDLRAAIQTGAVQADGELAAEALSAAGTIAAMRREPLRAATLWAAADTVRGPAPEHKAVAGLRDRWQQQARLQVSDQAAWDAATHAGAELALEDALALAAQTDEAPEGRATGTAPTD
jgi:hypothetical protein